MSAAAPLRSGCSPSSARCSSPSTARPTSGACARATLTARCSTTSADAELAGLRDTVGELYETWRAADREHARLVAEARERAREIDSLTASLEEIEAIDPQPGEDVALRAEDERLAHADTLRLAASQALADLSGDEYAGEPVSSARDLIGSARAALASGAVHDEALRGLDERLHEVGTLVGDLAADLTAYLDDVELDPAAARLRAGAAGHAWRG